VSTSQQQLHQEQSNMIDALQSERAIIKAENEKLREKLKESQKSAIDQAQWQEEISNLQAQLAAELSRKVNLDPAVEEERRIEIARLQSRLAELRGKLIIDPATKVILDPAEDLRRKEDIRRKAQEINDLKAQLAQLAQSATAQEVETQRARIAALEEEIEQLRNGEELSEQRRQLAEYGEKVRSLESEIARLLGVAQENPNGQTTVWVPIDSSSFIHQEKIKAQHVADEKPLKDSIEKLKEGYNKIKGSLIGLSKMNMNSLNELDSRDVTSFVAAYQSAMRIRSVRLPAAAKCKELFEKAIKAYEAFQEDKGNEIAGLTEYTNLQNTYQRISDMVSLPQFTDLMDDFNQRKNDLIKLVKAKALKFTDKGLAPYIKLVDWLEKEFGDFTLTSFVKRYTIPTLQNDKDYNNSPFVLIQQHTALGQEFDNLRFHSRTHFKTKQQIRGLDAENPFQLVRVLAKSDPSTYGWAGENLIDQMEKMYMMHYMQRHWQHLKANFDGDLIESIKGCNLRTEEGKPLLEERAKVILCSLIEEEPLKEGAIALASKAKDLDQLLSPTLSYKYADLWASSKRTTLRKDVMDIYTTYRGLVRTGLILSAKNPKIKEFHDE
jgi:hypothetical protein